MKRILQIIPMLIGVAASGQTATTNPSPPITQKAPKATGSVDMEWVRRVQAAIDKSVAEWDKPAGPDTRIIWCRIIHPSVERQRWIIRMFHPASIASTQIYPDIQCSLYPPLVQ
jgi:hypothetical protein